MPHRTRLTTQPLAQNPALLGVVLAASCTVAGADELLVRVIDQHGAPLQNAVVTVSAGNTTAAAENRAAEIAQVQQQFAPRVTVVRRGTDISFPNTDSTQHHVYSFSDAKQFEIELYRGDQVAPVHFDKAGIVALGCNIHDWMLGYVFVTDDPHSGISDASGVVSLPVSMESAQTLTAWHPAGGIPLQVDVASLPAEDDGSVRITVQTGEHDPLEFPIDPLQGLFGSDAP